MLEVQNPGCEGQNHETLGLKHCGSTDPPYRPESVYDWARAMWHLHNSVSVRPHRTSLLRYVDP